MRKKKKKKKVKVKVKSVNLRKLSELSEEGSDSKKTAGPPQ